MKMDLKWKQIKRRIARWASFENAYPMRQRIRGYYPDFHGGYPQATVTYGIDLDQIRVFKSRDDLGEFLVEMRRVGAAPLEAYADGQTATFDDSEAMAAWLTSPGREFDKFSIRSGPFSLSTENDLELIGRYGTSLHGTVDISDGQLPAVFPLADLVHKFEGTTRDATRKERNGKTIPYAPTLSREAAQQQHGNKSKGWKNAGTGVLIAVVAGIILTVVSKIIP